MKKLEEFGARVVYPLEVEKPEDVLKYHEETLKSVACKFLPILFLVAALTVVDYEFPSNIAEFITCFEPVQGITTLKDVIEWNEQHPDIALPKRTYLKTSYMKLTNNISIHHAN